MAIYNYYKATRIQTSLKHAFLFQLKFLLKRGWCVALPRWGSWRGP